MRSVNVKSGQAAKQRGIPMLGLMEIFCLSVGVWVCVCICVRVCICVCMCLRRIQIFPREHLQMTSYVGRFKLNGWTPVQFAMKHVWLCNVKLVAFELIVFTYLLNEFLINFFLIRLLEK